MSDRATLAKQFLNKSGWGNATSDYLAGDASNRSYQRLTGGNKETAVLMDAPPSQGEDTRPFVKITNHLLGLGLSAPEIIAQDEQNGFLLIEDMGDNLFTRHIHNKPDMEHALYSVAVDVLIQLHQHSSPKELLNYTPSIMADYISPVFDWYHTSHPDIQKAIKDELEFILAKTCTSSPVLALRDYHAENLLWLPNRSGTKRAGLLDYQDAVLAHPSYDLVSLLEDARRDVPLKIQTDMIARYVKATKANPETFQAAYCANGAQRNLRILGIFSRLCTVADKPGYIVLIPRVWSHLKQDLSHPSMTKLKTMVFDTLPEPTPEILQRLRKKCL